MLVRKAYFYQMLPNFSLQDLLAKHDFDHLNDMQTKVLEHFPSQDEIILLSNTGSGKTLAFLLAILQQIQPNQHHTQALIIAPSRELAMQIDEVFRKLNTKLKVCLCYGGHKREIEENNLLVEPVLIIGTAGRLADHIRRGSIRTEKIECLVLDEFDKSIELGFLEEIEFIISSLPTLRKKILCSATAAKSIPEGIQVKNPFELNFIVEDETASNKDLEIVKFLSPEQDKINTLFKLLCYAKNHPAIVFCNHRDAIERVAFLMAEKGIECACYHGGMEQHERESELAMFRNGTMRVLITTDLGARGLDIPGIRYILHYHLPLTEDSFTHRNGRTARMFDFGTAIILLAPDEEFPSFVNQDIKLLNIPDTFILPEESPWITLHFSIGKKDKVNKIDIVGFLSHIGALKKDDIGLIEVKDFFAFAAIRRKKLKQTLNNIQDEKIKGKKVKINEAKLYIDSIQQSDI